MTPLVASEDRHLTTHYVHTARTNGYAEGISRRQVHFDGIVATQIPGSNTPVLFCGLVSLEVRVPKTIQEKHNCKYEM